MAKVRRDIIVSLVNQYLNEPAEWRMVAEADGNNKNIIIKIICSQESAKYHINEVCLNVRISFVDDDWEMEHIEAKYKTSIFDELSESLDSEPELFSKVRCVIEQNKRYKDIFYELQRFYSDKELVYLYELTQNNLVEWVLDEEPYNGVDDMYVYKAEYADYDLELVIDESEEYDGQMFHDTRLTIYVANYLEIVLYDALDDKFKKLIHPVYITVEDCIVRTTNYICVNKKHTMYRVRAIVNIYTGSEMKEIEFEAAYCENCDKYFILENDYRRLRARGYIACKVIEYDVYIKSVGNYLELNMESFLHQYGYNVNAQSNLSTKSRRDILAFIIENEVASADRIVQFLSWLIEKNQYRKNMSNAIKKWEQDIDYLRTYKPVAGKIRVRSIYRKVTRSCR